MQSKTQNRQHSPFAPGAFSGHILLLLFFGFGTLANEAPLFDLKCYPPDIHFSSARARQRIIVQAAYGDGITRDVTAHARYRVLDPKLARLDEAILSPFADGKTELRISFKGQSLTVPVTITNATV